LPNGAACSTLYIPSIHTHTHTHTHIYTYIWKLWKTRKFTVSERQRSFTFVLHNALRNKGTPQTAPPFFHPWMCGEPSWSQRLFAWVLGTVVTKATRRLEPVKQKIFSASPPSGKVLEIGEYSVSMVMWVSVP